LITKNYNFLFIISKPFNIHFIQNNTLGIYDITSLRIYKIGLMTSNICSI